MKLKSPVLNFPFVAADGVHICRVEFDVLGAERYFVDENLIFSQWSLLGSKAEFISRGAAISIHNKLVRGWGVTEVSVNGNIVFENLLKEHNESLSKTASWNVSKKRTPMAWFARILLWFALVFFFYFLFK